MAMGLTHSGGSREDGYMVGSSQSWCVLARQAVLMKVFDRILICMEILGISSDFISRNTV